MHLDADFRAEIVASDGLDETFRAACAYLFLALGLTGTLAIVPTIIGVLAARGFR